MTEKRYCIVCGKKITSGDPDVVFCPDHGGPEVVTPSIHHPEGTIWEGEEDDAQPISDSAVEWRPGQIILDTYEIKEILGQGGFGSVYRAHHRGWNIDLAVKRALIRGEKNKAIFIDEAENWIGLGLHPNIVSCYYVRVIDGFPHTFSEVAEGKSLHDWIVGNGFSLYEGTPKEILGRILDIAIQFAWGLAFAHDQGLIHQDVKPQNALMTPEGVLKVTDFGLAKAGSAKVRGQVADPGKGFLVSGSAYTRAYCSPEQAAGLRLSLKTDIWSWGVSLLELFSGEVFWMGGQAAVSALESYLKRKKNDVIPSMPEKLVDLLRDCFQNDPDERPDDMQVIAKQLQEIYLLEIRQAYPRKAPKPAELRADSLNNKALTMIDLGKPDEAEELLNEAVRADSVHPAATYNLSLMEWHSGRIDDLAVVDRLTRLLNSTTEKWQISYLLGWVHAERGDVEKALDQLKGIENRPEPQQLINRLNAQASGSGVVHTFRGHKRKVSSVAFSRDGKLAITASSYMKVWNLRTGECQQTLTGHKEQISDIAVTPDGDHLITSSWDNTLKLWQLSIGACIRTYEGHTKFVNAVVVTPDGKRIISGGSDNLIKVWNLGSGDCIQTMKGHTGRIITLALSKDGRWLISAGNDKVLRLWDLRDYSCHKVMEGHKAPVNVVRFSADQKYVVSGCGPYKYDDDNLWVWDLASGTCIRKLKVKDDWVMSVACSPVGDRVLSGGSDHELRLWDQETGVCFRTFDKVGSFINVLAYSSDGMSALSGEGTYGSGEKLAHLWNLKGIAEIRAPYFVATPTSTEEAVVNERLFLEHLKKASFAFQNQVFDAAQKDIIAGRSIPGYEQDSRLMEIWFKLYKTCKPGVLKNRWIEKRFELHENEVYGCALSPDGKTGLSASWDETIRLWDLATGDCLKILKGHVNEIEEVKYSTDGQYAFSCGGDETVRMWHLANGECIKTFQGHTDLINCLNISHDGRMIVTAGMDNTVILWDIRSGHRLRTFENFKDWVSSVVFTPDAKAIVIGCGSDEKDQHTLQVWDLLSSRCLENFDNFSQSIWSVAVSPDGTEVLAGTGFGKIFRFDLISGDCLEVWEGPSAEVCTLCFSQNGRYAFSGGSDGILRVWDMASGSCVHSSATHKSSINCIAVSNDGQRLFSGSSDLTLQLWALDWELKDYQTAQWDDGALSYLEKFLSLHTPYAGQIPQGRKPTEEEIRHYLTHKGKPSWTEKDFQDLLIEIGHRGYGWLQPEGVRHKLEELAGERC